MANALNGSGKIVLVAPTTGLVAQQARMAKEFINLDSEKIVTMTGSDRPAKRQDMWKDAKIVMATPHVIRNDARNGRILLSDIDLLIVDEAHHATGSDSMAQLGDLYLEASSKCNDTSSYGFHEVQSEQSIGGNTTTWNRKITRH